MKHMLSSALFAGFAAGLICALLQYFFVEPDILMAERYESGDLVHFQGAMPHSHDTSVVDTTEAQPHHHDTVEASPILRHGLTILFAIVTYCGYAFVLLGGVQLAEQSGIAMGRAQSLLWGLAGFMAFQLMPALGLPPELPGTPSADLYDRQVWWAVTAIATMIGLWFAAYGTALWQRAIGLGVLAVPHLWGAPKPDAFGGVVPPELSAAFAAHSLGVGMITWMALGGLVVYFWQSEPAP